MEELQLELISDTGLPEVCSSLASWVTQTGTQPVNFLQTFKYFIITSYLSGSILLAVSIIFPPVSGSLIYLTLYTNLSYSHFSLELPSSVTLKVGVTMWLLLPSRMWVDVMCTADRMVFKYWSFFSRVSRKKFKSRS